MEGLRKGSLFPFSKKGRGEGTCPGSRPRASDDSRRRMPLADGRVRASTAPRPPGKGPCPSAPSGLPLVQILLASRWRMGYLPLRAHAGSPAWRLPCGAQIAPGPCRIPSRDRSSLPLMVRRSGACLLQAGCPGGAGSGMTWERPEKSGFSGRGQKKRCLLPRLGIWTFDCVREVAAWGR